MHPVLDRPLTATSRRTHLTPRDLEELREKLLAERKSLVSQYQHDVDSAHAIREEGGEDEGELAEMDFDRDLLYDFSEAERERLRLVEEALERMDGGSYGLCLISGQPIPRERLEQLPWARYRVEIQQEIEEGLRREG
jgi:DnaK suppressor protein